MPSYKHQVVLSCKQRKRLKALSKRGEVSARKLTRAHILLLADQNRPQGAMSDNEIHQILNVQATVTRVRKKFATCGLEAAIEELSRCGRPLSTACANHCLSLQYSPRRTQPMVSEVAMTN